jgi:hypothetical protein
VSLLGARHSDGAGETFAVLSGIDHGFLPDVRDDSLRTYLGEVAEITGIGYPDRGRNRMRKQLLACGLLVAMVWGSPVAAQEDVQSGNFMLPGCRYSLNSKDPALQGNIFRGGLCSGIVSALSAVSTTMEPAYRFCVPNAATFNQQVQVVVRYMEQHSKVWHEPFVALALVAMREAWPCPAK